MQRINLAHNTLSRHHLSARRLIMMVLVALLLAAAWSALQMQASAARQQQLIAVQAEVTQAERALQAFRRANPEVSDNSELMADVERLQTERGVRRQLLNNLQRSAGLRNVSYFSFMEALANQRIDGVWLTGFGLDNRPGSDRLRVQLAGEAENAELLPLYLNRLRDSRLGGEGLVDLTFNNLDLERLEPSPSNGIARYRFQLRTETRDTAARRGTAAETNRRSTP